MNFGTDIISRFGKVIDGVETNAAVYFVGVNVFLFGV